MEALDLSLDLPADFVDPFATEAPDSPVGSVPESPAVYDLPLGVFDVRALRAQLPAAKRDTGFRIGDAQVLGGRKRWEVAQANLRTLRSWLAVLPKDARVACYVDALGSRWIAESYYTDKRGTRGSGRVFLPFEEETFTDAHWVSRELLDAAGWHSPLALAPRSTSPSASSRRRKGAR